MMAGHVADGDPDRDAERDAAEPGTPKQEPSQEACASANSAAAADPQTCCTGCRLLYSAGQPVCPWCGAANIGGLAWESAPPGAPVTPTPIHQALGRRPGRPRRRQTEDDAVLLLYLFGAMMAVSAIAGAMRAHGVGGSSDKTADRLLMVVLEAVDTALVMYAFCKVERPVRQAQHRLMTLLAVMPLTLVMIGANLAYHRALIWWISPPAWTMDQVAPDTPWAFGLLAECVQPAVVEELFFRFLFLGILLTEIGPVSAIAISAVLFGLAHSGVPLSIPYLMLMGVAQGAVYYWGGLVPAMALHFLHNLSVAVIEHFV